MLYESIINLRDLHDLLRQQNEIAFWRCPAAHLRQFWCQFCKFSNFIFWPILIRKSIKFDRFGSLNIFSFNSDRFWMKIQWFVKKSIFHQKCNFLSDPVSGTTTSNIFRLAMRLGSFDAQWKSTHEKTSQNPNECSNFMHSLIYGQNVRICLFLSKLRLARSRRRITLLAYIS